MRTKEEIQKELSEYDLISASKKLTLEVLLDIRELLFGINKKLHMGN